MQQIAQIALLIVALIVGIYLVQSSSAPDEPQPAATESEQVVSSAEKMLSLIEVHIADQEDVKDVRCWSSVNKIQTFLSGLPVELEANGQRVEQYVQLIDDIWRQSSSLAVDKEISRDALFLVLKSRFPDNVSIVDGRSKFDFGAELATIEILEEAVQDYSDTIESWRLLQSWALRKASQQTAGSDEDPSFTAEALQLFRDFLVVFDVGLLKSSKQVAMDRKFSSIDAKTIDIAFDQLQTTASAETQNASQ